MALALAVPNVGLACTAFLERLAALAAFPQVARSLGRLPLVARSLCCRPKWLGACVAWVGWGGLGHWRWLVWVWEGWSLQKELWMKFGKQLRRNVRIEINEGPT